MALSGQALGRCSMTRVFSATTRAASFTRRSRRVSNCATRQVERFGEYSYVYLTSDSAEALIAKVPGDCYTPCGEAMSFSFDPAHCHVFDTEGLALAHLAAH